eukprot:4810227-Lingulodinium_polyedra.AAC.1
MASARGAQALQASCRAGRGRWPAAWRDGLRALQPVAQSAHRLAAQAAQRVVDPSARPDAVQPRLRPL